MDERRGDSGEAWRLPEHAKPPRVCELVERIDEAVAIARASEAAVMTVGAAALDAAEQAKRAADLAERASAALRTGPSSPTAAGTTGFAAAPAGVPTGIAATTGSGQLESFAARADRVAARLARLQRLPLSA